MTVSAQPQIFAETAPEDRVHSAIKVIAVRDALAREGISAAAAFAGSGIDPDAPLTAETRVALTSILRVYANAARLSASRYFAFQVGTSLHVASFGLYGFAILSSTDFRETIAFATKYHLMAAPLVELSLEESGCVATWLVEPVAHPLVDDTVYRFIVEMQYGHVLSLHRDVMGPNFIFEALQVRWLEPADSARQAAVLGCRIDFGSPLNRFAFATAWLDGEARLGNESTLTEVIGLCDARMKEISHGSGAAGRVRFALLKAHLLPSSIEAVADELGMSVRTLRRRLSDEGTSFRNIRDDLRRDLALQLLQQKGRTVEEIAFALGFSDASNFRHAFRRWTDQAPRQPKNSSPK